MKYKHLIGLLLLTAISFSFSFQPGVALQGTWASEKAGETQILLIADQFFAWTTYKTSTGEFIGTKGGIIKQTGKNFELTYEFYSQDSTLVGSIQMLKFSGKPAAMKLKSGKMAVGGTWKALDAGKSTSLTGSWLIAGRKQNDEITKRSTDGPRKTMKILAGNHFQWTAYHITNKQFLGCGGGTYTAENGKYSENLSFFSRDNKRVGMALSFDFKVEAGDWHHSGLSSTGNPIYEVWERRKK